MPKVDTIQVFINNKCSQSIVYREYSYRQFRKQRKTGNIVWRCVVKTCSATVTTGPDIKVPLKQNRSEHDHGPAKVDVRLKELRWAAKQAARSKATIDPVRYLEEQLRWTMRLSYGAYALRQMMYRERRKGPWRTAVPGSLSDVVRRLQRSDVTLDDGQRFVHVIENGPSTVVVVTCLSNLLYLRDNTDAALVDVTSHATARFPRAYTVHGVAGARCVPLAYCFVPPGPAPAGPWTHHLWTAMHQLYRELVGVPFAPAILLLNDLTPDTHAAAAKACPGTVVRASRYYVGRAWDARIYASSMLRNSFRKPNTPCGRWLRSFFGLPYLPPEMVAEAFVALMAVCPRRRPFAKFADYVLENYVDANCGFAPHRWAQQPANCDPNAVVSYFGRSKKKFRVPLSDIFHSIDVLKRNQKVTDSTLKQTKQTANNDGCSHEIDEDKNFVSHIFGLLTAKEINLKNYLGIVGIKFTQTV